ncbi:MAG: SxtJ family membrane protein [Draconibacterium sp.]|nr:SxtJ family membrane protein [Draconibacterium sp.]
MDKAKTLETSLVLTTAFLVIYLITGNNVFLYLALAFGISGIFIKPLAEYIAIAWFKLADVLNYIISKIILGTLFFVVLFPVSVLYKISNKDKLRIKRSKNSMWIERNHTYSSSDLENIW